jgi:hypothetical protein
MKVNRNHCYYCGIAVDPNNYEEIGNTTIWVCDDKTCQKELSGDIKIYISEENAKAEDDRKNGWMSY